MASSNAQRLQYLCIGPAPWSWWVHSCDTKSRSVSVMLETVPNSQTTTPMEITAGNTMARPVKKLARQRRKFFFFFFMAGLERGGSGLLKPNRGLDLRFTICDLRFAICAPVCGGFCQAAERKAMSERFMQSGFLAVHHP